MARPEIVGKLEDLLDWLKLRWTQFVIPLGVAVLTALVVQFPFQSDLPHYRAGEISRQDIRAASDVIFVDEELTKRRQEAAAQAVLPVFDVDAQMREVSRDRVRETFRSARPLVRQDPDEFQRLLAEGLDLNLLSTEWQSLQSWGLSRAFESALLESITNAHETLIYDESINRSGQRNRLILRDLLTEREEILSLPEFRAQNRSVEQARDLIRNSPPLSLRQLPDQQRILAKKMALQLIQASVSLNPVETETRREEARQQVERVVEEVSKGQMIVREGDKIEARQALILERLRMTQASRQDLKAFAGFTTLLFLMIFLFYWVGTRNFRKFRLSSHDRIVLGGYFVVAIALIAVIYSLFQSFADESRSNLVLLCLLPLGFAGMTLRLFTSMEITSFLMVLFSVCVGWMTQNPFFALTTLIVGLSGAAAMRHVSQRMDVLKAGVFTGLIQAVCVLIGLLMGLVSTVGLDPVWVDLPITLSFCVLAGLFSAGIVLFSQPVIEFLGYTTDLRLMELSSNNHPLLREMIIKAPGSYFHSFTVSQLSEKAAEAVNANPLFARVASLYHDVGKLKKPQYFIENIKGENRHDKMVPSMSALIIANHVKDGIELAHQYKLPQAIIDCIPQHHGTALISYFYDKARKNAEDESEVDERDYRYPGPKPQTKEAAIIMLADAVEAASKSLSQAGPDQLRQQVNATIRRFFLDGQLDECDLSLKDLNAIGNAFVNVLQGVYHQRIDYPHLRKETPTNEETKTISKKSSAKSANS
ncbi:MAG: HDIG domain-containing protein [Bradymonadales bacterium]|nr:MAG: HDIG domain-containing protein [Bradymonadales bacterium]